MPGIGSAIALTLLCTMAACGPICCETFYVSPGGDDSWTGTLASPNKAGTDGPFATLERARDTVRALRKGNSAIKPVTVVLRRGTYRLDRPFVLGPEDSGVTYKAATGESAQISGGRVISGFTPVEVNGWRMTAADVPEVREGKWSFAQLFANDRRLNRTRLPRKGYYWVQDLAGVPFSSPWNEGQTKFTYKNADIKPWKNLSDVDVVALHFWVESRMPIKSVDESAKLVELAKKSVFRLSDDFQGKGGKYYVENVFEALDTPGQWYLDRSEGRVYYYPIAGEDTKRAVFVAPVLDQLVRVEGTVTQPAENVRFENLRFAHTEWKLPADRSGSAQAAHSVPGVIFLQNAKNCAVTNCEIAHIGNYAVEVGGGCSETNIERNRIADMGAGGVKIHPGSEGTTVADNDIGDGGKVFMSAVGVWIGNSPNNKVLHNHIHNLNYTGVSLGWVWGYGNSEAKNNIIEQNHIHHVGREVLSDLAGIYSLGIQPGTVERNNLIHDCISASYGGWGIYTDEGSSNILIEDNVVYNTKTGGFHQHYGKENILRNNIFALSRMYQLQRTRPEEHKVFTFERNIVYYDQGVLLGSNWSDNKQVMDYNLYWDASGKPVDFAGLSFEDWKTQKGQDKHSLVADPKFVDPMKHDFRLQPDSPAFALGFKPIDVSRVGPRVPVGPVK